MAPTMNADSIPSAGQTQCVFPSKPNRSEPFVPPFNGFLGPHGRGEPPKVFDQKAQSIGSPERQAATPIDDSGDAPFGLVISVEEWLPLGKWIRLLPQAMREVGSAAETLGVFMDLVNPHTPRSFMAVPKMAQKGKQLARTFERHLRILENHGFIANLGRQPSPRSGIKRRTCTWELTPKTLKEWERTRVACERIGRTPTTDSYGALPLWACGSKSGGNPLGLSWGEKAIVSVLHRELIYFNGIAPCFRSDLWTTIAECEHERFRLSLEKVSRRTGITKHTAFSARQSLQRRQIIDRSSFWMPEKSFDYQEAIRMAPSAP